MAKGTKKRIYMAAGGLFARKGYHATSVQEIADAAGVLPPNLYYYFASKEDLLFDILTTSLSGYVEEIRQIGCMELSGREKVSEAVRRLVHSTVTSSVPAMMREHFLDVFAAGHLQQYIALRDQYEELFKAFIREGIADGSIIVRSPSIAAFALLGMANSVRHWYRPNGGLSIDDIADQFVELAVNGVTGHAGLPATTNAGFHEGQSP